jgi:amidase
MTTPPPPPFNPLTTTASQLQSLLRSGHLATVEILRTYLSQISQHNHSGAELHAVINTIDREVGFAKARMLDEERRKGKVRGGLHGLVVVVKDCFLLGEGMGMGCSVGARVFEGSMGENAGVVKQVWMDVFRFCSGERERSCAWRLMGIL